MAKPYSVLIIDDHPLLRRGLCQLLLSDDDFILFDEAGSGEQALALLTDEEPDLILLDLNMQGMSGLDTLQALRLEQISSRIIVLTVSDNKQDVIRLMQAGADGYLLKDTDPDQLLELLKQAMQGQQVISQSISDYLSPSEPNTDNHWQEQLTPREIEIVESLVQGLTNRAIADKLFISEGTVKVHMKNLLRKAGAKSRTEIAVQYLN
ncbi:response regulator [Shewanella marina]|uniref:response regulator n=1 Tax=Shewanella marina TaxID=487319 RepID=UPI00046E78B7|nr:response regulator [Shewanella marina]